MRLCALLILASLPALAVQYRGKLAFDLYRPAKSSAPLPVAIFLNGIGADWIRKHPQYSGWASLATTAGYAGIAMDSDPADVAGSFEALISHLRDNAAVTEQKPRPVVDIEKQKEELLEHHCKDRRAHFENNAVLALSDQVEEGFISVRNGAIARRKKSDFQPMLEAYFKNAKYYEWDDLEPPIIRISDDGSMAWMIVRIRVRRTQPSPSRGAAEEKFVYAGITTYERRDGKWFRVANVSTFESGA